MPELYQVVGTILRDIAQARAISDLYSRDISRFYEADPVLRRFPVPRAEISEASFSIPFLIDEVKVDTHRRNARNARLSQVFENYGGNVVRVALKALRTRTDDLKHRPGLSPEQVAALDRFEARFLAEDYRNLLRSRLVRYFEENRDELLDKDDRFNEQMAVGQIRGFIEGLVGREPDLKRALDQFQADVQPVEQEILAAVQSELNSMQQDITDAIERAQDFTVSVEINPEKIQAASGAVCSITVKSTIRNYTWSKVDDDTQDIRSIRTLSPE